MGPPIETMDQCVDVMINALIEEGLPTSFISSLNRSDLISSLINNKMDKSKVIELQKKKAGGEEVEEIGKLKMKISLLASHRSGYVLSLLFSCLLVFSSLSHADSLMLSSLFLSFLSIVCIKFCIKFYNKNFVFYFSSQRPIRSRR